MALQRKKDGSPNVRYFESSETISQYDGVKQWIQKNCKKVFVTWPGYVVKLKPRVGSCPDLTVLTPTIMAP